MYDEFVKVLLETITLFFTDDPLTCPHLGRPVSARHHARITRLISETKGDILVGGVPTSAQHEEDSLFLAPTIVALTSTEDVLMSEEIFGPVLPLIRSKSTSESIKYVNNHEIPLALYAFSCDNCEVDDILTKTRSGSIAINDTVLQVAVPGSFLGGLGESGMGAYGYGRGFVEFSHERPVLWSTPFWSRFGNLINPHVMGRAPGWLERGIRFLGKIPAARGREHESSLIAE